MLSKTILTSFAIIAATSSPFVIRLNEKNVCASYLDYFLVNFNGNCYYNPDVNLNVPDLIKKYTNNLEIYPVNTKDGYILTMFRIYQKNPKGVILLQPPMSSGAIAWVSDGPKSLAFTLWTQGYDVWLSNYRGTEYSRQHQNLTDSDSKFWDFSFHEIAVFDLDAQFEIIANKTQSKVIFVGYSMASTAALIYASVKPDESQKYVESYILLAPVLYMENFASPFKYLFYIMGPFEGFLRFGEFMTFELIRFVGQFLNTLPFFVNICTSIFMGWTPNEMDPMLYPFIFARHGRGISNKMIYHYGQIYFSGTLATYDNGLGFQNYFLNKIKNNIYIISGDKDDLATPLDVQRLCMEDVSKEYLRGCVELQNHNHIDFIFSKYREEKAYKYINEIIDKETSVQNKN